MKRYYMNSWNEVIKHLGVDIYKGLSGYDAHLRREQDGSNKISLKSSETLGRRILSERVLLYILIINCIFYLYKKYDIAIITTALLISIIIFKLYQKSRFLKRENIIENINYTDVMVLREGKEFVIKAEELVKGDIVLVNKGSLISADIRIITSNSLKVNDSSITGDALIKEKFETKLDNEVDSLAEISNMLFRGSSVVSGSGSGVVVEIGDKTQLGIILSKINDSNDDKVNISRNLQEEFIKLHISLILFGVFFQLIIPGSLNDKVNLMLYWTFGSLIGNPLLIQTIHRKFIVGKFKKEEIELAKVSAIGLAEHVNVMFLNTIGTLTKRELEVKKIYVNQKIMDESKISLDDFANNRLLESSLLANDGKSSSTEIKGDMFEKAYMAYGKKKGITKDAIEKVFRRIFILYMDSEKRLITAVNKNKKGCRASSRGSVEDILKCCTYVLVNGVERPLDKNEIDKIKLADLAFSREGFITEAFAYRSFNYTPSESENIESNLTFLGLIALENPLIEGVKEDIKEVVEEEVLPLVFTNSNKIVGERLGKSLGIVKTSSEVVSGIELEHLTLEEFYKVVSKGRVFCKISPRIKNKILEAFNNDGYKVLVEGETLQEIATIKKSFISIAKSNSSKLIQKASDVYSKVSPLKAFRKIKSYNEDLNNQIKKSMQLYSLLMVNELVAATFYYFLSEKLLFNIESLVAINLILFMPIILLRLSSDDAYDTRNWFIVRCISFGVQAICSIFLFRENYLLAYFMTIGANLVLHGFINYKTTNKSYGRFLKLAIVALLIFIVELGVYIYKLNGVNIIEMGSKILILQLIFSFMEFFIKKWK